MNFSFVDPWHQFLPREGGHVVALCGSGGKTSLMMALAGWYRQEGVPLFLTTTTRTEPLAGVPVSAMANPCGAGNCLDEPILFLRSGEDRQGKWLGLSPEGVDRLGADHPDRLVLVEADGAGKLPLKLYREGEPVWPARTSLALVVMGLGALGEKAQDVLFRFGRVAYPALAELQAETRWTWDHYHTLLTGPGGYLEQVPADVPVVLVLAGMGGLTDSIGLFDFMGKAMTHPRIPLGLFCETSGEKPSLRTVCRRDESLAEFACQESDQRDASP